MLKMVDGVVLVVDAFEGPMPQTKFVLRKALELNHPVVVCVNKVDRPEARPDEVVDEVLELFMELDANEDQLDSPFVFASARGGYASEDANAREGDMKPLFEAIINHIPAPKGDVNAPAQALISTIDYSEYLGRIGIGKIENGVLRVNDEVVVLNMHNAETQKKVRITKLYEFQGLQRVEVKEASVGNIVALSGIENIMIGDTICSPEKPEPLPFVKISEPTLAMNFSVNDSPFAGQEGKYVTLTTLPVTISTAVATAALPSIAASVKLKEKKQVRRKMALTYRISMIISVPAAVGISALGPQIIHMLFPSASDGGTLLTVGGVSIIFLALCQTSTGILQGIGHIKVPVVGAILGAITKVILNMVLIRIPSINVLGAVLSTTGCYLVAGVFDVIMLSRLTGTKFDIMGSFLKPIIGSAAMAAATLGSYHVFYQLLQSNTIATLLAICIAVAVYGLVMLLIKGIVEEDLQTVPGGGKLIRVCRRLHLL